METSERVVAADAADWPAMLQVTFEVEQRRLWGACYRMAGCAADADDWLHDAYERALSRPPPDLRRPPGPWLMRLTMNICRDQLRRRQHRAYVGPWLPGPVEESMLWGLIEEAPSPEARYGQLQSVSLAFLTTLEALTPNQRAVLVLRDVFDLSTADAADTLELSETNVKTTLHRARQIMERYEGSQAAACDPADVQARRDALYAFFVHFSAGNTDALAGLLSDDVVMWNDGGGRYYAAKRPVHGREKVLLFHRKTARVGTSVLECDLGGTPAMMIGFVPSAQARLAPRAVAWVDLDSEGRICQIYYALADRKLQSLPWERARLPGPRLLSRALGAALRAPAVGNSPPTLRGLATTAISLARSGTRQLWMFASGRGKDYGATIRGRERRG